MFSPRFIIRDCLKLNPERRLIWIDNLFSSQSTACRRECFIFNLFMLCLFLGNPKYLFWLRNRKVANLNFILLNLFRQIYRRDFLMLFRALRKLKRLCKSWNAFVYLGQTADVRAEFLLVYISWIELSTGN